MPTDKLSDNQELSKAEIVRDVIIAVLGNNEMFLDNYLLILAHFGIVLMFITQIADILCAIFQIVELSGICFF